MQSRMKSDNVKMYFGVNAARFRYLGYRGLTDSKCVSSLLLWEWNGWAVSASEAIITANIAIPLDFCNKHYINEKK